MQLQNVFVPLKIRKGKNYERIKRELESGNLHPKVMLMLYDVGYWVWRKHHKAIYVTHAYRSQKKQEEIYGKGTSKKSSHMYWRAVDIIVDGADDALYREMEAYLDGRYPYHGSEGYSTSDPHDVGLGMHLHIQVGYNEPFNKGFFEKRS